MTRVVVVFGSRHGSTAEVAERVAERMRDAGHQVAVSSARSARTPLAGCGLVVVGGSLYSGHWHSDAHRFLRHHRNELTGIPVAVFGMGPRSDDPEAWASSRAQLDRALGKHDWLVPIAVTVFGGRDPEPKHGVTRDLRDWAAIDAWAEELLARTER